MSASDHFSHTKIVAALALVAALVAVAATMLSKGADVTDRAATATPEATLVGKTLPHAFPRSHPAP
jgi:hypothetical protein